MPRAATAPTSQAVILARGLGTRMRRADDVALDPRQQAAAEAGSKGMMPLPAAHDVGGGRPFLSYVLGALADAGIKDVVLVVAPEHEVIRRYFTDVAPPTRVGLRFAVQREPRGTADAVLAARDAVRDAPFLALNADNYYSVAAYRAAAAMRGNGVVAYHADDLVRLSGLEPERVLRYALLDIAPDDTLRAIREKPAPDHPLALAPDRWVSMNLWSFTPAIFEACERVTPSPRGELELQSAVTTAIRELGARFAVARVHDAVLDLTQRSDIAAVSARLRGLDPRP